MISYIDILQFLLLGVVIVFAAGNVLSLRSMVKLLAKDMEADIAMHALWRDQRDEIVELKNRFNQLRMAGVQLEDDLKGVFENNGIAYASTMKVEPRQELNED